MDGSRSTLEFATPLTVLVFDGRDGRILGVRNPATGHEAIAFPSRAGLFRIELSDGLVLDSNSQVFERYGHAPGELNLRFPQLEAGGRCFEIEVVCRFQSDEETGAAVARIEVRNDEPGVIVETVAFPVLDGLGESLGNLPAALLAPYLGGELRPRPVTGGESDFAYPYPNKAMSWLDLFSDREGLYFASHDPTFRWTTLCGAVSERWGERALALWLDRHPWIRAGETWLSPDAVIAFHDGDWHSGARLYRTWSDRWFKPPTVPRRVRESRGLMDAFVKDGDGRTLLRYEDLPTLARAARDELGMEILHVCGWHFDGFDTCYPQYEPLAELGGARALRSAIEEVRSLGMLADLYINCRIANTGTTFYRRAASDWAIRRPDGSEVIERYNRMAFAPMCPWPEARRRHFVDLIERIAGEYQADGIQVDQPHSRAWPCFDDRHGHPTPYDGWGPGFMELFRQMRGAARQVNRDFFLWGEAHSDVFGQFFDVQQYYIRAPERRLRFAELVDGEWVDDANRGFGLPEAFRYAFPELVLFNTLGLSRGEDPAETAVRNRVWAMGCGVYFPGGGSGWKIDRVDPGYRRSFRRLYDARLDARAAMLHGRFVDTDGIEIDTDGGGWGKAYVGSRCAAVTLVNPDRGAPARFRLRPRLGEWVDDPSGTWRWRETVDEQGARGEGTVDRIAADGVEVEVPVNGAALVRFDPADSDPATELMDLLVDRDSVEPAG